ncbi:ATP-dependent DNA helicase DinG [Flocculibacter collagenilyticus]|uniref:ATP-dependent DNA helicase DinG n=1 Tax=Flocculibacter collagenilyticus TaxID=2744479 RepID=UPI0018F676ED|nr:ATP-dependent DNA helicase DinG [Flocculibacter collagenilyticus]
MLSDFLKTQIRGIHQNISSNLTNYRARPGQNKLVAEIAKTLAGEYHKHNKICVIEAGTGTGKSLAYLLGAIPYALAKNKQVVIATATVALQEQLFEKDLPFFAEQSKLSFNFELLKGRNRYVCVEKLEAICSDNAEQLSFQQLLISAPSKKDKPAYKKLLKQYQSGKWDGERDHLDEPISDDFWHHIASDKYHCTKRSSAHQMCPYHQSRENLDKVDVIIANHSLLLADLELGGGKILPETENTIFIIDEAHHLPTVARDFSASQVLVKSSINWLAKLPKLAQRFSTTVGSESLIKHTLSLTDCAEESAKWLKQIQQWLHSNEQQLFTKEKYHRFENGELPPHLLPAIETLKEEATKALSALNRLHDALTQEVKDQLVKAWIAEPVLAESSFYLQRLESFTKLWRDLCITQSEKSAPQARWLEQITFSDNATADAKHDFLIANSPIEVGFFLQDHLWSKAYGVVLCSATLTALNSFDYYARQAGLFGLENTQYIKIDSPFDYPNKAKLVIPKINVEPSHPSFTEALGKAVPLYLKDQDASLVLFASYWQMKEVAKQLREKGFSLLVQGEASRGALLTLHKQKCDGNSPSILFGTQSFSEGLDLPGKYLTNLIITKIPFAVPTSPIEEAQNEYIKQRGGNPFLAISVPEASKKLVQGCGRLLRQEDDSGRVVVLDRRLVTKQYGQSLINSLPPFKREIEY